MSKLHAVIRFAHSKLLLFFFHKKGKKKKSFGDLLTEHAGSLSRWLSPSLSIWKLCFWIPFLVLIWLFHNLVPVPPALALVVVVLTSNCYHSNFLLIAGCSFVLWLLSGHIICPRIILCLTIWCMVLFIFGSLESFSLDVDSTGVGLACCHLSLLISCSILNSISSGAKCIFEHNFCMLLTLVRSHRLGPLCMQESISILLAWHYSCQFSVQRSWFLFSLPYKFLDILQ